MKIAINIIAIALGALFLSGGTDIHLGFGAVLAIIGLKGFFN